MNSFYNNLSIGKVFISLDEINSTNSYAKALLSKNKPLEGTVILARYQTDGKGQFGKIWESERGKNLTFSTILYPIFLEARKAFMLNQAVCLALKDFMASLNIEVQVKWPNDIYYHEKKLAGLLIENGIIGENLDYSIVGIGLNVNQTIFNSAIPNPTSLKLISGNEYNTELLFEIFSFIEKRYLQLKSNHLEKIKDEYTHCLYKLNKMSSYQTEGENFIGTIRGVNEIGQLIVEVDGSKRYFNNNEIIFN